MAEIKSFTVQRGKWDRGKGDGKLLDPQTKKMCCLGFFCLAAGLKRKQIRDFNASSDIELFPVYSKNYQDHAKRLHKLLPQLVTKQSMDRKLTLKIMEENDRECDKNGKRVSDEKREKKLTKLFEKMGVEVTFTGKLDSKDPRRTRK